MKVLTDQLARADYMLGNRFQALDVLWGTALTWMTGFKLVEAVPVISAYIARVNARPAVAAGHTRRIAGACRPAHAAAPRGSVGSRDARGPAAARRDRRDRARRVRHASARSRHLARGSGAGVPRGAGAGLHVAPLSAHDLLYVLIAVHALILIAGGAYTYARVPLGHWLQELFGFERNPYDRIGHFAQGFVPALIAREVLLRNGFLSNKAMTAFLSGCVAMAISACYELVEWASAVIAGGGATDFLGTQGDPWDAQGDMLMALIGATCALLLLSRFHDRQMAALARRLGGVGSG